MRRALSLLLILVLLLSLTSCSDEVHAQHCELGIVLPKDFMEIDTDASFDLAYSDGDAVVGLTRLSFDAVFESGIPATVSVRELAELYQASHGVKHIIYAYGDTVYYSYTVERDGAVYIYMPTFYKTPYAFFVITFILHGAGEWTAEEALALTSSVYLVNG